MSPDSFFAKLLRFTGIVLMGLTAGFTLLGGIGTTCVALNPAGFSASMAKLAPFQWLYILFVLAGIALGVMGIRATVLLVKGAGSAYREALVVLVAGTVIGVIHIVVSRLLRGSSMPVDAVVYTTLLTLVIFLLFRIPYIWQGVDFTQRNPGTSRLAGSAAAILVGLLALTIQFTMGPTHTWQGTNYAGAFGIAMAAIGLSCLALGIWLVFGSCVSRVDAARAKGVTG